MSWSWVKLGELIEIKHGFPFKSKHFSDQGRYILLTPGNCHEEGGLKLKGAKEKYYAGEIPDDYLLSAGDLLVVMTDLVNTAPILGGSFIIPEDDRFLHNQRLGLVTLKDNSRLEKKFLHYLLNTHGYRGQVRGAASGATVRHTSPDRIKGCEVRIPDSKKEQLRISSILSAYDDLIENNRRRIQLLEESARLLYKEWFVHLRFPGHEHVKVIDGVPEGWGLKQVKELLGKVRRPGKIQKADYLPDGPIPCVDQSREFIGGYTDRQDAMIEQLPIIVFGDHTRILKFIDFPFACGADGTQLLVSNDPEMSQEYFFFALDSIDLSNYFYARHFKFLKDQYVLRPPVGLIEQFTDVSRNVMRQIKTLRQQNEELTQARDILLPKLMNGEISV